MIAYEIQLRCVTRGKIQSETKLSQKKNSWIFSQTELCLRLHVVLD